ncbi:MAG: hypothetical protein KC591_07885 [Gemmatimonadetes bacterium]|nr:hypothetical protein [Gemmatimonadota bacterium]
MRFRTGALAAALVLGSLFGAGSTFAGDSHPFSARQGESLARSAAAAWAADAQLVYVENDEALDGGGTAERWGYLFWSEARQEGRAYSVRDGKIRTAADLGFEFPAPPLDSAWIDSGAALAAADEKKGNAYRTEHGGKLRSMVLVRGLLNPDSPDATTWAVVYESESASGLWVVVDARDGKVVKTWRG